MRTSPEVYATKTAAEWALWRMADDGRADWTQDQRFRALVLLATFASLRWGEVSVRAETKGSCPNNPLVVCGMSNGC
jgi:hypothetical protein